MSSQEALSGMILGWISWTRGLSIYVHAVLFLFSNSGVLTRPWNWGKTFVDTIQSAFRRQRQSAGHFGSHTS